MYCSSDTYVYNFAYLAKSYCSHGYNYYSHDCCDHAWIVGGACILAFALCAALTAMVVCVARKRKA